MIEGVILWDKEDSKNFGFNENTLSELPTNLPCLDDFGLSVGVFSNFNIKRGRITADFTPYIEDVEGKNRYFVIGTFVFNSQPESLEPMYKSKISKIDLRYLDSFFYPSLESYQ